MKNAIMYKLEYVLAAWARGADYEHYHMDCSDILDDLQKLLSDKALDRMADNARELGLTYDTQPTEAERLAKFSEQHNEKMRLYRFAGSGDGELTD